MKFIGDKNDDRIGLLVRDHTNVIGLWIATLFGTFISLFINISLCTQSLSPI